MIDLTLLKEYCGGIGCEFRCNASMKDYTTFRIGGPADVLALPDTSEKLRLLASYALNNGIDYCIIGKGSNVLVSDSGIRGLVICTSKLEGITFESENVLKCSAGTPLIRLCTFALENSLSGLEFAYGIPGSAGGAVYMNAGAYGGEMKDIVVSADYIDNSGNVGTFGADELELGYRHSVFSNNNYVIIAVTVKLVPSSKEAIKARMDELLSKRKEKQPLDYPSAGSTFKRPEGFFAGALIEQSGLKGYSVGGAQVSEKHAGFVINKQNATAADVLGLVKHIKQTVFNNTGVMLEPEIKFIG